MCVCSRGDGVPRLGGKKLFLSLLVRVFIVARVGGICGSAADLHLHLGLDEDFPQSSGLSLSPPGLSPSLSCAVQLAYLTAARRQSTLDRWRLWKSSATADRRVQPCLSFPRMRSLS